MIRKIYNIVSCHSPFYWGFITSCILIAILLRDFILYDNWNFMADSLDRGFVLSFAFINDWLNGGIQLWNRYNQLPYTYTHIQTGFYDLPKFFASLYFSIINPGPIMGPDFRMPFIILYIGLSVFS